MSSNRMMVFPELVSALSQSTNTSAELCEVFLKDFFAKISESLIDGQDVVVEGMGRFMVADGNVAFEPCDEMRASLNAAFEFFEPIELDDDYDGEVPEDASAGVAVAAEAVEETPVEAEPETVAVADSDTASVEPEVAEAKEDVAEEQVVPSEEEKPAEPEAVDEPEATAKEPETQPEEVAVEQEPEPEPKKSPETTSGEVKESEEPAVEETPAEDMPEKQEVPAYQDEPVSQEDPEKEEEVEEPCPRKSGFWKGFICGAVAMAIVGGGGGYAVYYQREVARLEQEMQDARDEMAMLTGEIGSIATPEASVPEAVTPETAKPEREEVAVKEEEPRKPEQKPASEEGWPKHFKVSKTDYLSNISRKYYGHYIFWVYIYLENESIIRDPNNLPVGQTLNIPAPSKYGIDKNSASSVAKAEAAAFEVLRKSKR